MSDPRLQAICDLIQEDPGNRGLRADPADNLITRTAGDFEAACRSLANASRPHISIVTGFYIAHADPPCGETDGPLGALFLARALVPLGFQATLVTDPFGVEALEAGLQACGLKEEVPVLLVSPDQQVGNPRHVFSDMDLVRWASWRRDPPTHLVALERVGPSHHDGRCYSMRGRDITEHTNPAHVLFEMGRRPGLTTIGIGDGGNEIGMGKIHPEVIERNIPRGALIACRVPTDHLIVAGVSNWGAYGLAAGVRLLRGAPYDPNLFDPQRDRELLQIMVDRGPLVDGVAAQRTATVDGLPWARYARVLEQIGRIVEAGTR
jgi:hypothetical protein